MSKPRHFGIVSPPVPGHIHPFGALARELIARGHRVSFLHMADLAARSQQEQMEFIPLGITSHPPGTLPDFHQHVTRLSGWPAMRYTIANVVRTSEMFCRDLPESIEQNGIDALLVDQMEPAGGSVAEHLQIPFVTVCNALPLNREPGIPPPFTPWAYNDTPWARLRNAAGYAVNDLVLRPVMRVVAEYRRQWNLKALQRPEDSWSPVLQLCQMSPLFDFPRQELPRQFHYTGPLRRPLPVADFPWDLIDGSRPLVYASLGTLQNGKEEVFRIFAKACEPLRVQLLITHGGGLPNDVSFPGNPIVVPYAPQLEVLKKASMTLTHAGLNTVLDSLSEGVPLVAVPITYEQPAIAARLVRCGAGMVTGLKTLDVVDLRNKIDRVLSIPDYREGAKQGAKTMQQLGGVNTAATLIEGLLQKKGVAD